MLDCTYIGSPNDDHLISPGATLVSGGSEPAVPLQDAKEVSDFRAHLFWAGFTPITVKTRDKAPKGRDWQKQHLFVTPDAVLQVPTPDGMSTGILCRGLRAIDIDIDVPQLAQTIERLAERELGLTVRRHRENSSRVTLLYRAAEGTPKKRKFEGQDSEGRQCKIEVLGDGQQTVLDGLHKETGVPYHLSKKPFVEFNVTDLPAVSEEQISKFLKNAEVHLSLTAPIKLKMDRSERRDLESDAPLPPDDHGPFDKLTTALKVKMVHECLDVVGVAFPKKLDYNQWLRIGFACCDAELRGAVDAFKIFHEWSEGREDYDEKADLALDNIARDFKPSNRSVTVGSLIQQAKDLPGGPERIDSIWRASDVFNPTLDKAGAVFGGLPLIEVDKATICGGGSKDRGASQTEQLLNLLPAGSLFHSPQNVAYADVWINGHRETLAVKSTGFSEYLSRAYYEKYSKAPNSEAKKQAIETMAANAKYSGSEMEVALRIGEQNGKIYIDLGNENWDAIEIDECGWRVVAEPLLRFRRAPGLTALPQPKRGGSFQSLKSIVNIQFSDDYILTIAWILATFRSSWPFPVLVVTGEQGSAKSTYVRILKRLTDPSGCPLQSMPKKVSDIYISTNNSHVLAYDNISALSSEQSDSLCRISTGGGYKTRRLYTDDEEMQFDARRPIVLNGITDFVFRPDLAERSIMITLQPILSDRRKTEEQLECDLRRVLPEIFGAVLDAISNGLKTMPLIELMSLPRMADFAKWSVACGDDYIWPAGAFMSAFERSRNSAIDDVIANDSVAVGVILFLENEAAAGRSTWQGTAGELLQAIRATSVFRGGDELPATAGVLSNRLKRSQPFLRQRGVSINFTRSRLRRIITLNALQTTRDATTDKCGTMTML